MLARKGTLYMVDANQVTKMFSQEMCQFMEDHIVSAPSDRTVHHRMAQAVHLYTLPLFKLRQ